MKLVQGSGEATVSFGSSGGRKRRGAHSSVSHLSILRPCHLLLHCSFSTGCVPQGCIKEKKKERRRGKRKNKKRKKRKKEKRKKMKWKKKRRQKKKNRKRKRKKKRKKE